MPRASLALSIALSIVSCADPTHDERVQSLGPEPDGEEPGPLHRRGQPCLVCHGPEGPAESELAVAGTVYQRPDEDAVVEGAEVTLVDAAGDKYVALTNQAGNFYLPASSDLLFPLRVEVKSGTRTVKMRTEIGRDGSCATCHSGRGDAWHMPRVYMQAP